MCAVALHGALLRHHSAALRSPLRVGLQILRDRAIAAKRQVTGLEEDVAGLTRRNDELCKLLLERSTRLEEALGRLNAADAHATVNNSKVDMLHSRVKELQASNEALAEQLRQHEEAMWFNEKNRGSAVSALTGRLNERNSYLAQIEADLSQRTAQLEASRAESTARQEELIALLAKQAGQQERHQGEVAALKERLRQMESEMALAEEGSTQQAKARRERQAELDQLQGRVDGLMRQLAEANARLAAQEGAVNHHSSEAKQAQAERDQRAAALAEMEAARDGAVAEAERLKAGVSDLQRELEGSEDRLASERRRGQALEEARNACVHRAADARAQLQHLARSFHGWARWVVGRRAGVASCAMRRATRRETAASKRHALTTWRLALLRRRSHDLLVRLARRRRWRKAFLAWRRCASHRRRARLAAAALARGQQREQRLALQRSIAVWRAAAVASSCDRARREHADIVAELEATNGRLRSQLDQARSVKHAPPPPVPLNVGGETIAPSADAAAAAKAKKELAALRTALRSAQVEVLEYQASAKEAAEARAAAETAATSSARAVAGLEEEVRRLERENGSLRAQLDELRDADAARQSDADKLKAQAAAAAKARDEAERVAQGALRAAAKAASPRRAKARGRSSPRDGDGAADLRKRLEEELRAAKLAREEAEEAARVWRQQQEAAVSHGEDEETVDGDDAPDNVLGPWEPPEGSRCVLCGVRRVWLHDFTDMLILGAAPQS